MVRLNKIYTRTGDDGTTSLGDGERVTKYNIRVEAYGSVDEANAAIGLIITHLDKDGEIDKDSETDKDSENATLYHGIADELLHIQNDLFDLGADLCVPDKGQVLDYTPLRIQASQVKWLEAQIDAHNQHLTPLKSFILPGGHKAAAYAHLARTITRRAERQVAILAAQKDDIISKNVLHYLNRLSDYLFVIARRLNDDGVKDILWVAGQNR